MSRRRLQRPVTQRVAAGELDSLVDDAARAALAIAGPAGPAIVPVLVRRDGEELAVGIEPANTERFIGLPVMVLVDDGRFWFELRAIAWRGRLDPARATSGSGDVLTWLPLRVEHVAAWDYARLHEVGSS
jgi:hypothetical protein